MTNAKAAVPEHDYFAIIRIGGIIVGRAPDLDEAVATPSEASGLDGPVQGRGQ